MWPKLAHLLSILCLALLVSCGEDEGYGEIELWNIAKEAEPDIQLVRVPNNEPERRILCSDYGPGCVQRTGRRIKVRMVELIAIQFEDMEAAKKEAYRIDQYYAKNWVFDNVAGEPVLEDFVEDTFDAKRPREEKKKKKEDEGGFFYFF